MRGVRRVISFLVACLVLSSNAHGTKIEKSKKQEESSVFWLAAGGGLFILVAGGVYFLVPGKPSNENIIPIKNLVEVANVNNETLPKKDVGNPLYAEKQEKIDETFLNSLGFNDREKTWIRFLAGEEISDTGFRFRSCGAYREASNNDLENFHDYIQIVFPNESKSGYANEDLYTGANLKSWKRLIKNESVRFKIQKQLNLNLIRILEFWNFNVDLGKNSEIKKISANKKSIIFKRGGDHNHLRFTRVLNCLRLFGLHKEHELLLSSIKNNNEIMNIINSDNSLTESKKLWVQTNEMKPLS